MNLRFEIYWLSLKVLIVYLWGLLGRFELCRRLLSQLTILCHLRLWLQRCLLLVSTRSWSTGVRFTWWSWYAAFCKLDFCIVFLLLSWAKRDLNSWMLVLAWICSENLPSCKCVPRQRVCEFYFLVWLQNTLFIVSLSPYIDDLLAWNFYVGTDCLNALTVMLLEQLSDQMILCIIAFERLLVEMAWSLQDFSACCVTVALIRAERL